MPENVLVRKGRSLKPNVTVKAVTSIALVALAVVLPQLVHAAAGQTGGVRWLPMYLPVLIGGCLLGTWWGLGIGVASPIVSFLLTLAFGNPMPAAARLPFMTAELAVFAAVSGMFCKKIAENGWLAFPAVLLAQFAGRSAFMLLSLVFRSVTPFTPADIWAQIQAGLLGTVLQAVVVPLAVMGLKLLIDRDNNDRFTNGKE